MTETNQEPAAPEVSAPKDVDSKAATGVGVYDVTLRKFVGGKFASKADADAFIKGKDTGHDYVTRRV